MLLPVFSSSSSSTCLRQHTFKNKKASPLVHQIDATKRQLAVQSSLLSRRNKLFFLGSRYVLSMAWFVERSHSPHSDQLSSCHCPRESKCILREMVKKELQGCWRQVVCGEIGLNKLKRSRTHKQTPGRLGQTQMW